jgi:nucleoid DNA-binding protein
MAKKKKKQQKTKKDIIQEVASRTQLPQMQIKLVVKETLEVILKMIVETGRMELRDFGIFVVKRRKARRARNPLTEEEVFVESKNVVTFHPGKKMEQEVIERNLPLPEPTPRRQKASANSPKPLPPPVKPAPQPEDEPESSTSKPKKKKARKKS